MERTQDRGPAAGQLSLRVVACPLRMHVQVFQFRVRLEDAAVAEIAPGREFADPFFDRAEMGAGGRRELREAGHVGARDRCQGDQLVEAEPLAGFLEPVRVGLGSGEVELAADVGRGQLPDQCLVRLQPSPRVFGELA